MSMNDTYQPINCDDYDNLELACQHHLMLTLELKDGEKLQAKASDLVSRKNVEYLVVEAAGATRELRLDKIPPGNRYGGGERVLIDFAGCDVCCVLSGFHLTKRFLPDKTDAIHTFSHTFLRHKYPCRRNQRFAIKQQWRGIT